MKDPKEGKDFIGSDLPDGVTLNGKDSDPLVIGHKRRSDVFAIFNDANHASRRMMKQSVDDRVHEQPDPETVKPSKVKYVVVKGVNLVELDTLTKEYRQAYGQDRDADMVRLVLDNMDVIRAGKGVGELIKRLVLISLSMGLATYEEHVQRINYALANAAEGIDFRVDYNNLYPQMRNLKINASNNNLIEFIQEVDAPDISSRSKRFFLPPEFMAIESYKLYELIVRNSEVYTMEDLRVDAKDYFDRIEKDGREPITEDLDDQGKGKVEEDVPPPVEESKEEEDKDTDVISDPEPFKPVYMVLKALGGETVTIEGISAEFGGERVSISITMSKLK